MATRSQQKRASLGPKIARVRWPWAPWATKGPFRAGPWAPQAPGPRGLLRPLGPKITRSPWKIPRSILVHAAPVCQGVWTWLSLGLALAWHTTGLRGPKGFQKQFKLFINMPVHGCVSESDTTAGGQNSCQESFGMCLTAHPPPSPPNVPRFIVKPW